MQHYVHVVRVFIIKFTYASSESWWSKHVTTIVDLKEVYCYLIWREIEKQVSHNISRRNIDRWSTGSGGNWSHFFKWGIKENCLTPLFPLRHRWSPSALTPAWPSASAHIRHHLNLTPHFQKPSAVYETATISQKRHASDGVFPRSIR